MCASGFKVPFVAILRCTRMVKFVETEVFLSFRVSQSN